MSEKSSAILPGTVEKIIKSPYSDEPEKAQISVEGADHLYREIRIDNTLTNENGDEVSLKRGAHVEVTVEAAACCAAGTASIVMPARCFLRVLRTSACLSPNWSINTAA